jgi:hypothetical protein
MRSAVPAALSVFSQAEAVEISAIASQIVPSDGSPGAREAGVSIPEQCRDELDLDKGAPVAVLRIGEGLVRIPEQNRFRILCDSIAPVLDRRQLSSTDIKARSLICEWPTARATTAV